MSSAAALTAVAVAPVAAWLHERDSTLAIFVLIVCWRMVWYKHAANIRRLIAGTEPRIWLGAQGRSERSASRRTLPDNERIDWLRLSRTANASAQSPSSPCWNATAAPAPPSRNCRASPKKRGGKVTRAPIGAIGCRYRSARSIAPQRLGARYIAACEPDYPESLAAIDDAPPVISAGRDLSLCSNAPASPSSARATPR